MYPYRIRCPPIPDLEFGYHFTDEILWNSTDVSSSMDISTFGRLGLLPGFEPRHFQRVGDRFVLWIHLLSLHPGPYVAFVSKVWMSDSVLFVGASIESDV